MYRFTVNGTPVETEQEMKLLPFLREELGLKSVKNGCAEGVCGSCTVMADGKAVRACVLTTARAEGKHIVTCEGLSERERRIFAYAFSKTGAVQCGFCTPGMVMALRAFIGEQPDPLPEELEAAIRGNLCRCTGYKKIVEAGMLAARMVRENAAVPPDDDAAALGERMMRVDAPAKALGEAQYADDLQPEGMLFGGAVRSAYARARVLRIDVSEAKKLPGVAAVLTAADIPGKQKLGHLKKDYDALIPEGKITHFCGDALALIAAADRETLEAAKKLVRVDYEPLPGVFSAEEARAAGAPLVHGETTDTNLLSREHLVRGDADAAIAAAAYSVTMRYTTPATEHAFLEPEAAVACPDGDGVVVYSGDQGVYQTRKECAELLGLPPEKVRVKAMAVGGGFGGKEDMSVQHHAALLAYVTQKPVKVAFSRDESLLVHPKRHPMEMEVTTSCDAEGHITAFKARLLADTGAYASLGGPVLQRACTHAAGPYAFDTVDILGEAYYTNNPPCGAFRGFGVPQSCFAGELNLDLLAEKVGISPWEIRFRNAIRPGGVLPNGQIADESTAFAETLLEVKPYMDAHPEAGIACAMKNSGLGVGVPDTGRCRLLVRNGAVEIHSSAACIGQGIGTVLVQMVHDAAGIPREQLRWCAPDTADAPDSGNTTASRQTVFAGEAARRAAAALAEALGEGTLAQLEGREFLGEYTGVTDPLGSDKPNPVSHVAYGFATHVVQLGEDGRVRYVLAVHDVGTPVNPTALEGQVEGGVTMSLGWALTERFPLEQGRPKAKLGTLGLLRAPDVPPIEARFVQHTPTGLAAGAKGIGEIASIPTAPAVALAYYNRDGVFRTSLPLAGTPYERK